MIVVVGDPVLRASDGTSPSAASGSAAAIAAACIGAGAIVQIAGKIGDDPAGDEVLISLSRDGIGHVALLRDAGRSTPVDVEIGGPDPEIEAPSVDAAIVLEAAEQDVARDPERAVDGDPADGPDLPGLEPSALSPEDLDLALRYLVSFEVLVVAQPVAAETLAVAAEAASFSGAHLVVAARTAGLDRLSGEAVTILEPPQADPDGDFVGLVARYAAALDAGQPPAPAFRAALGGSVWEQAAT